MYGSAVYLALVQKLKAVAFKVMAIPARIY
jgi:hypothetical protein